MDVDGEIADLLGTIPHNLDAAFVLAKLLTRQGDVRGEILRLSYTLLLQDVAAPERQENEHMLQQLLALGYLPLVPFVTNCLGMKFSFIPRANITTGHHFHARAATVHEQAFFMSVTPVTQAQWNRLMPVNPSFFENDDNPVEGVLWADCVEYCHRLSEMTGQRVRLPTSAEWEYACRACTSSEFHSGNGEDALASVGWYAGNSECEPHPVAEKTPNAWGLFDMHGNVYEWCETVCVIPDEEFKCRVLRGGAWGRPPRDCGASSSRCYPEDSSNFTIGFRVCFSFV